jgi:hypothetical protein
MTKLTLALTVLFILPFASKGQKNGLTQVDSMVQAFTEELQASGFQRIGYTRHYCVGYNRIFKASEKCEYTDEYYQVYLFWEDSTVSYVKKFDNCGAYLNIQMSTSPFFDYYAENETAISADEVAPFEFSKEKNGKEEIKQNPSDHSCRRDIVVTLGGNLVTKTFDLHNLKKKDGDKVNLHYSANSDLALVDWDKRTSKFIWKIEKKGWFVRDTAKVEEDTQASLNNK